MYGRDGRVILFLLKNVVYADRGQIFANYTFHNKYTDKLLLAYSDGATKHP